MDGTTEPIVAVIGHPIAGNPSQFALERALAAMKLEWRVLSCDVEPDQVPVALDGAEALRFRGLLVDRTLSESATQWDRGRQGQSDAIDCLYRDADGRLAGHHEQRDWLTAQVAAHRHTLERDLKGCLWLGGSVDQRLIDATPFVDPPLTIPPDADELSEADLIVVGERQPGSEPFLLELDDWPAATTPTLLIDLTAGHPEMPRIRELGYQVISTEQRRIGTLGRALQRWTGIDPPTDVIRDAIEEYLAV